MTDEPCPYCQDDPTGCIVCDPVGRSPSPGEAMSRSLLNLRTE